MQREPVPLWNPPSEQRSSTGLQTTDLIHILFLKTNLDAPVVLEAQLLVLQRDSETVPQRKRWD